MKRVFHWGLTAGRPPMTHFFLSLYAFKYLCWIWLTVAPVACALFSLCVHFCRYLLLPSDQQLLATPGCPEFIVCCFSVLIFSLFALLSPQPVEADSHPPRVCFWLFLLKRMVYFIYYIIYLFIVKCLRKKSFLCSSSKTWLLWLYHVMGPMTLRVLNWSTIV